MGISERRFKKQGYGSHSGPWGWSLGIQAVVALSQLASWRTSGISAAGSNIRETGYYSTVTAQQSVSARAHSSSLWLKEEGEAVGIARTTTTLAEAQPLTLACLCRRTRLVIRGCLVTVW